MTLDDLHKLLKTVMRKVYHYDAAQATMPYIVYAEYYQEVIRAENRVIGEHDYVQVDYYTRVEKDKRVKKIKDLLNVSEIYFEYKIIYEREDRVFHHIFDCSLL